MLSVSCWKCQARKFTLPSNLCTSPHKPLQRSKTWLFLPEAFPRVQKTLEIQLQVAKKESVYVLEHLKYNTSPLEGRGNFIECSILNVVVLNTARGITHSARTWECVKDCSLWMSPLNGPLRSSHCAHVNTVQLVPSKETKACKVERGLCWNSR